MGFKNSYNIFLISAISIFAFFCLYQINLEDLWYDELLTFWITNPSFSNQETYQNIILYENTPPLYYFIIKYFFNIFGYNPDFVRYPNVIFNILSLFILFKISRLISDKKFFIYSCIALFSLNYFIVSYSQEARVYSFFCFTSTLYIYFYLKTLSCNNIFTYILFFLSGFVALNSFIFSALILTTIIFFEIINYKKIAKFYIIQSINALTIIISIYLNLDFIESIANFRATSINLPDFNFYFLNFFFKQFFGSKIMGLIFFLCFLISLIKIIKNLKKQNKSGEINFLSLVILISYAIPLAYGYIFQPVLNDKYIIYIVPIIIIIISFHFSIDNQNIYKKILIFLIFISFLNLTIKIKKSEIDKPEFSKIINEILQNNNNDKIFIYGLTIGPNKKLDNLSINNYLEQKIISNELIAINKKIKKNTWVICYDPSNLFEKCLKTLEAIKFENNIKQKIKRYMVSAYLL